MNRLNFKTGAMAFAMAASALGAAQGISVTVNGAPVEFRNGQPQYRMGRVLVPLRGVFEEMGAFVQWRPRTQTVVATKDGRTVRLRIGERTAVIDGRDTALDVPAQIVNGSTMVPIRFLSESLGAGVTWNDSQRVVMIDSNGGRAQSMDPTQRPWPPRRGNGNGGGNNWPRDDNQTTQAEMRVLQSETVIPVELDTPLSSNESREGDRFTATVRTSGESYYGFLPAGTRIEGRVVAARKKQGKDPGLLELDFSRIRFPNGKGYDIDGQLISLDNTAVTRSDSGEIRAKAAAKDNRTVYAGYGAGAGLLVGLLTKKPVETGLLGGILGYLAGEAERAKNRPADVQLKSGTEFGVRLTQNLAIDPRDIK